MNKEKIKSILGVIIIVVVIVAYLLLFYPAIVSVDQYGEPKCQSILGLTVNC